MSRESRNQLAFLLAITERFHIVRFLPPLGRDCIADDLRSTIKDHAKVTIFDPVFRDEDVALLTELKLCRLTENKASPARPGLDHLIYPHGGIWLFQCGMHPVDAPTVLFMPHCETELYESILRANWTLERISNILLIANHLEDYVVA